MMTVVSLVLNAQLEKLWSGTSGQKNNLSLQISCITILWRSVYSRSIQQGQNMRFSGIDLFQSRYDPAITKLTYIPNVVFSVVTGSPIKLTVRNSNKLENKQHKLDTFTIKIQIHKTLRMSLFLNHNFLFTKGAQGYKHNYTRAQGYRPEYGGYRPVVVFSLREETKVGDGGGTVGGRAWQLDDDVLVLHLEQERQSFDLEGKRPLLNLMLNQCLVFKITSDQEENNRCRTIPLPNQSLDYQKIWTEPVTQRLKGALPPS